MRKLVASLGFIAAVFAGGMVPSQAAVVTNLGVVNGDASFTLSPLDAPGTLGACVDDYTFTLTNNFPFYVTAAGVTNAFTSASQHVTGLSIALFSGSPIGSAIAGPLSATDVTASLQLAQLPTIGLGPGSYY